jgi:hypothetical protein
MAYILYAIAYMFIGIAYVVAWDLDLNSEEVGNFAINLFGWPMFLLIDIFRAIIVLGIIRSV